MTSNNATTATAGMINGQRADTARRRQRVVKAINDATNNADEITVSAIASRAAVDRTFLYRHRDLLEQIQAAEAQPLATGSGPAVSRASLQADLLAAQHRCARQAARTQQLENRLSELLGEHAWRQSGLGAPDDIDLRLQLQERDQDIAAARAANRELMNQINTTGHHP